MNLGTLIAEGTMRAVVEVLHRRGMTSKDVDTAKLTDAIKIEAKLALGRVIDAGEDMLEANVGEGWLCTMVNTECVAAGLAAVEVVCGKDSAS